MDRGGGSNGGPCYYTILGIRKDASISDIRTAYRKLAMVLNSVFVSNFDFVVYSVRDLCACASVFIRTPPFMIFLLRFASLLWC